MSQTHMDPRPLFFDQGNEASSDGMLRNWVNAAIQSRMLEDSAFCRRHRAVEISPIRCSPALVCRELMITTVINVGETNGIVVSSLKLNSGKLRFLCRVSVQPCLKYI